MNKRNIGVIVTSTALVGAALGGGIAAVVYSQNRTNAYAPTTIQKERMSLLGSFLNDGDNDSKNTNPSYKGNPFAIFSRDRISSMVAELLNKQPALLAELGYVSAIDPSKSGNLISRMSLLRLEKDKDTILIMFKDNNDKDYKSKLLKININIKYDTEGMQNLGHELNPFMLNDVENAKATINPLPSSEIDKILKGLGTSDISQLDKPTFQESLIESLILWKVYGVEFNDQGTITTVAELADKVKVDNGNVVPTKEVKNDIESKFYPFIGALPYYPSEISLDAEAQIINSDMDVEKTFPLKTANSATVFKEFKIATMMGLELFPDAVTKSDGTIDISPRSRREYSALSNVQESSEIEEGSGNNVFQSALNNYDYFIKGDD